MMEKMCYLTKMEIVKLYIIVLFFILSGKAASEDVRASIRCSFMPTGQSKKDGDTRLARNSEYEISASLDFFDERDFVYGVGYRDLKIRLNRDESGSNVDYDAFFRSPFLYLGYSSLVGNKGRVDGGMLFGRGKLKFRKEGQSTREVATVSSLGVRANYSHRLLTLKDGGAFGFSSGVDVFRLQVDDFNYNGDIIPTDDFRNHYNLSIGLFWEF